MSGEEDTDVRWIAVLKPGKQFKEACEELPVTPLTIIARIKTVFLPDLTDDQREALIAAGWSVDRNQQRFSLT